jgi:hypothetical protein
VQRFAQTAGSLVCVLPADSVLRVRLWDAARGSDAFLIGFAATAGYSTDFGSVSGVPECVCTIRPWFEQPEEHEDGDKVTFSLIRKPLPCTALDWTATGTVLAAAFGWSHLAGWDSTQCGVALFPVLSPKFDAAAESVQASALLRTESSVMALACHPSLPAVVAAGCQTGEVTVWRTVAPTASRLQAATADGAASAARRDGSESKQSESGSVVVGSSPIDLLLHQHPVRAVVWLKPVGAARHVLLSGCEGGRLLVWDPLGAGMTAPVAGVTMRTSKAKMQLRADAWDEDDDAMDRATAGRARRRRKGSSQHSCWEHTPAVMVDGQGVAARMPVRTGSKRRPIPTGIRPCVPGPPLGQQCGGPMRPPAWSALCR